MNKLIDLNTDCDERKKIKNFLHTYNNIHDSSWEIIFLNGADAITHFLLATFFRNKRILYFQLNYSYATKLIKLLSQDNKEQEISWNNDGIRILNVDEAVIEASDVIYITNPDNRFGTIILKNKLVELFSLFPNKIFIIDEAYGDYCLDNSILSGETFKNIFVIKTFSKLFELEPERVAYLIFPSSWYEKIIYFIPQYPISYHSISQTMKAISNFDYLDKIHRVRDDKSKIEKILRNNNIPFTKSHTNFIAISNDDFDISKIEKILKKNFYFKDKLFYRISCNRKNTNTIVKNLNIPLN